MRVKCSVKRCEYNDEGVCKADPLRLHASRYHTGNNFPYLLCHSYHHDSLNTSEEKEAEK